MNNYHKLYSAVTAEIDKFSIGEVFYLRDCIQNPPSSLGRWLFESVENGKVSNIIFYAKDSNGINQYKKIG